MQPTIYWITTAIGGRLGTMARPRGGEWLADELVGLHQSGVDTLVSLLTTSEISELELDELPILCRTHGLTHWSFPIPDFDVPPLDAATVAFVDRIANAARAGRQVAIHCRMGIGRSSLIAASALVMLGVTPAQAFSEISAARGRRVPDTDAQRAWVERFATAWSWLKLPEGAAG